VFCEVRTPPSSAHYGGGAVTPQEMPRPIQAFIGNTLRTFDSVEALNQALVKDQQEQEAQLAREVEEPPNE
jgi:hypothetical protein